jgi:hypothetical protein
MHEDERREAWEKIVQHAIEDFDELLRNLTNSEIRRLVWAVYGAHRESRPFYVADALHSMSAEGEPKPKRAIDDPNYSAKYNRLELAKSRGLVRVVPTPHDGRNRAVLPTAKLNYVLDEFFTRTLRFAQEAIAATKDQSILEVDEAGPAVLTIRHSFGALVAKQMAMREISNRLTYDRR